MKLGHSLLGSLAMLSLCASAQNTETRAFFATNPDNAVGKPGSITIDGSFSDWTSDMVIAVNGANNVATAYKGSHENNVLDIYALLASWDDSNLYIGVQLTNTGDVWAREGDGPLTDYGKIGNVPMILALSVNPSGQGMTGLLEDGRCVLCDNAGNGTTFDMDQVHVDYMLFFSAQPGQGAPGLFRPVNAKGDTNYGAGCTLFSAAGITYDKADGFMLPELWRCRSTAEWATPTELISDPSVVNDIYDIEKYDNLLAGKVEGLKEHDTAYDTFFEIKIPFSALGINREWLEANGIGARFIATRGESALDCCPFDPAMMDNALGEYGKDDSTTHEKDDLDVITYAMADVARIRDLQNIDPVPDPTPVPTPTPTPDDPTPGPTPVDPSGAYTVYYESDWSAVNIYLWDAGAANLQLAGAWPGSPMSKTDIDGRNLWVYSFTPAAPLVTPMVIFNNGSQTDDLAFVNYGVYNFNGFTGETLIPAAVETINAEAASVSYFDMQGRPLPEAPAHGLYIRVADGKASKELAR